MRRMMITLGATVAGTVAVLTHDPGLERAAGDSRRETDETNLAALAGDQVMLAGAGQGAADRTETEWTDGTEVLTSAGPVQVSVGLDAGAIRDVRLLRGPTATRHSVWLTRHAAAVLRAEVLNAQSADVDMISGATYTSAGYLQSLQAALDAAEGR